MKFSRFTLKAVVNLFLIAALLWAKLSFSTPVLADEHLSFERISDTIGGRQNSVYEIYRDKQDFLWFASDTDGLLRYDGYEFALWSSDVLRADARVSFAHVRRTQDGRLWAATWGNGLMGWDHASGEYKQFLHQQENPESLSNDRVQTLYEDSRGRLWVGTLSGLNYLQASNDVNLDALTLETLPAGHPLHDERIWRVAESDSRLWVATTQGLFELSKDLTQWQKHLISPEASGQNRLNEIRTVYIHNEKIWVGTDEGSFLFDPASSAFQHINVPEDANYIAQVRVNTFQAIQLGQTNQELLLVGTTDGLFAIDPEQKAYRAIEHGRWRLLHDVDIRTLEQDGTGGVWAGTRDLGVFYTRNESESFRSVAEENPNVVEELELDRAVFSIHEGAGEELWLGTSNGIVIREEGSGNWRRVAQAEGQALGRVESILKDSLGAYWVAANRNLYRQNSMNSELLRFTDIHDQLLLDENSITEIFETDEQTLLLGIWGLGLAEYDLNTGNAEWVFQGFEELQGDLVYDIVHVPEHGEWMVTRYSGLFYREHGSNEWHHFNLPESLPLNDDSFLCAYAWRPNELWLCSTEGVWRIDTSTYELKPVSGSLGNVRVIGMVHDLNNRLWMLSSWGLTRYNLQDQSVVTFGLNDGLPATEFVRQAIHRNANGVIAVGSVRGAVEFNPSDLDFNQSAPSIGLSRIWINEIEVTGQVGLESPELNLNPTDRSFTVQFSVLDFHDTTRNALRYRLIGLNNQWSNWNNQRQITFGSIAPGEYTLEVQGRNSLGIMAKSTLRIPIHVAKPWWRTFWFWTILGALIIAVFQSILKWRLRSLERVNARLDTLVKERTQELEVLNNQLKAQSQTDYLTKLPNRRGFTERFKLLQAQAQRSMQPMALIVCDIDHFKSFNDNYGHEAGDQVLMALGSELGRRLRAQDVAARWGGEEFAILLTDTDEHGARVVCENLRQSIENISVVYEGADLDVTASFGIYLSEDVTAPLDHWMHCADIALYKSKKSGRNRAELYTASMENN
ncbi:MULTISPECIES: ligand-binding sensor domain-containing diguanylate cyclase [Gammaproteobacteria]|uniref:ligand-binding sensor domain-containing diguanylate cyclase n=1 Tax=Gammaproteobacteria TaxID=1236 RepID=UPI000DD06AEC|nr:MULTISPECIES: ligand-binding sensor domain-containing diguanylate cyclase [Gammaproteobacteria]RTE86748.1 GGDEF domain-containing protein [Aliidiomarina sp. B3213]TCZ90698.1 GGDEF domain-containing protein [Lysobacter sp. N42]